MARSKKNELIDITQTDLEGRILELEEYLAPLEQQVFSVLKNIPAEHRDVIEGYLHTLAEHEMLITIQAYQKGLSRRKPAQKTGNITKTY